MRVAIDIGHARGTGARGNGLEEHAVVESIGSNLRSMLRRSGLSADVIDYPDMSNAGDLSATVAAINNGGYDMSVSLHCDCSDNEAAHGAHVCYCSSAGARIGAAIMYYLKPLMPGRAEAIVRRNNLMVLTRTNCPAVLVECGFISHPGDAKILSLEPGKIAQAITQGIVSYQSTIS